MEMFKRLSRAEMKNVTGGDMPQCYNCFINYPDGSTVNGPSCGTSFQNAEANLNSNILNHSSFGNPSGWGCNDSPWVPEQ